MIFVVLVVENEIERVFLLLLWLLFYIKCILARCFVMREGRVTHVTEAILKRIQRDSSLLIFLSNFHFCGFGSKQNIIISISLLKMVCANCELTLDVHLIHGNTTFLENFFGFCF